MKNQLLDDFAAGKKTIGTFFRSQDPDLVEAIGYAGLDYLVIDNEHGPLDVSQMTNLLRAAELRNTTALVRVKNGTRESILKMLDIGAKGLVIPDVHSLEEAQKIVEYGKYYPVGKRGIITGRAAGFGYAEYASSLGKYTETSNRQTMLIPQCETIGALEAIEAITALPGIDGILVGPFDLSQAMEIPGEFDSPRFHQALERIVLACKRNKIPSFIYAGTPQVAQTYFDMGFDSVAISIDIAVFTESYRQLLKTTRELME